METLFTEIMDYLPEIIYCLDRESRVVYCNHMQLQVFNLSDREQMIGKDTMQLAQMMGWSDELAAQIRANDISVMETEQPMMVEEEIMIDGQKRVFQSKKFPWIVDGVVQGLIGVGIDITEKKRADELHAKQLESEGQMRQMEIFASALAHELRTPLAGVNAGFAGLERFLPKLLAGFQLASDNQLLSDEQDIMPSKLALLEGLCTRNRNQINYALFFIDFSLMNIRHKGINHQQFATYSIVDDIELALAKYPFSDEERVKVKWQPSDRSGFQYLGDQTLTCHVLFNLLKNALYFIRYDRDANITIQLTVSPEYNQLVFTDTGPGIAEKDLPHIFKHFYTRRQSGSGIGLAFCQLVMQAYNGSIHCDSQAGQYTRFTLSFPRA